MADPREIHDGAEPPLPTPGLPPDDSPVYLTRPVKAVSEDGLIEVTLPGGAVATFTSGHEGAHEVRAVLVVSAPVDAADVTELAGRGDR